jgi:tRNA G18 (ribose-2'-O)-methylase SpoU
MDNKFTDSVNWNVRDELKGSSLDSIKSARRVLPYSVGLINVNGELNIGMSMRSAEIFGAREFFIFGKQKYDKRSTVGAQNYIQTSKYPLEEVHPGIWGYYLPIFIETGGKKLNDVALHDIQDKTNEKFTMPMFIFGSESEGIPQYLLDSHPENIYTIPQLGVLRSLNVSAAVACVCHKYSEFVTK